MDENCENLSRDGLRTLVISQKAMRLNDFLEWERKYKEAQNNLNQRDELMDRVISELEVEMDLLGVTGVEDKLQDEVA